MSGKCDKRCGEWSKECEDFNGNGGCIPKAHKPDSNEGTGTQLAPVPRPACVAGYEHEFYAKGVSTLGEAIYKCKHCRFVEFRVK